MSSCPRGLFMALCRLLFKENTDGGVEATFLIIYQTWEGVFHWISKHREVSWKTRPKAEFFDRFRGVWISDETLFWVFDIAFQKNRYFKRYLGAKLANFYVELRPHIQTSFTAVISFVFGLWIINEFEKWQKYVIC